MEEAYLSPLLEVILINPLTNIKQQRVVPVFLLRNQNSERVSDFPKARQLVSVIMQTLILEPSSKFTSHSITVPK